MRGTRALTVATVLAIAGCGTHPASQATARSAAAPRTLAAATSLDALMQDGFTIADADRDGALSGKESGLSAAQFKALDRDSDGLISREEWNYHLPEDQAKAALAAFQPQVDATFKAIDTDQDGRLSQAEIGAITPANGAAHAGPEPLSTQGVLAAMRRADANGDGALTRDEFADFYVGLSQVGARGWFSNIAQVVLGAYIAVTSRIAQHEALHPSRRKVAVTPAKWGYAFEEIAFKTSDGLTLHGWFIPAATPTDRTVIEVHGITDCRDWFVREGQVEMLHDQYNQLAFDLRNQGVSDGTVTSFGYHEAKDVIAARQYLEGRGLTRNVVYGCSLGASGAVRAAAVDPRFMGLIDDCTFSTVRAAFAGFISLTFIPCPELIAAATLERGNEELGVDMTTTEPISQMRALNPRPLLIIHGAKDQNIPPECSQLNYQAAGEGFHKELWLVPGATHAASALAQPAAYREHLRSFLQVAFGDAPALVGPRI